MRYFGFFLFLVLAGVVFFAQPVRAEPACGNGICESPLYGGNENSCTCPQDCGACAPGPFEVCRKYSCDSNNICRQTLFSVRTTGKVCCGNGFCEPPETFGDCPLDCNPAELVFDVLSPLPTQSFARGERVLVSIKISSSGRPIVGANAFAGGFFGDIQLFNDGKHEDGTNTDNIYANYFVVPSSALEEEHSVGVRGEFQNAKGTKEFPVVVKAELNPSVEGPSLVFLGDNITLHGRIFRGPEPAVFSFDLNLINPNGNAVDKPKIQAGADGSFSYAFHTSQIDPRGEWILNGYGIDSNNNRMSFSKTVLVENSSKERFLTVDFALDKPKVSKGETVTIIATISDFGKPVDDATIELVDSFNKKILFSFVSSGKYNASYTVPFEMPVGEQHFKIHAKRQTGIWVEGFKEFLIPIEGKSFLLELVLPTEKRFSVGDPVKFRVHAEYESNQPVLDANAFVIISGHQVSLEAEGLGFYSGEYILQESDLGSVGFETVVVDRFANRSSVTGKVEVFGLGPNYYLQRYGSLFLVLAAFFSLLFFVAYRLVVKQLLIQRLEKRQADLIELEKSLQVKYFEQASIEKKEFEQFMEAYENELKEVAKKIAKLKNQKEPPSQSNGLEPAQPIDKN